MSQTPELTGKLPSKENPKLAIWIFLGGEIILFGTLILTQILGRMGQSNYADFKARLNIPLVGVNTFVLIVSSFLVVLALSSIRQGKWGALRGSLLATIIAGLLFLGGQAYEWATLFGDGVSISNQFGMYFYTITGVHGTHVLIGTIWAGFLLMGSFDDSDAVDQARGVEIFGLYWHFVDVVWIVLFTLFYLVP